MTYSKDICCRVLVSRAVVISLEGPAESIELLSIVQEKHGPEVITGHLRCHIVPVMLTCVSDNLKQQKCIPVGCVTPACWPYPVVSDGGGGGSVQPPRTQTPWSCDLWCMLGSQPLPPLNGEKRMTDACENITLPQTSFPGGNNTNNTTI